MSQRKEQFVDQMKGIAFILAVLAAALLLWVGIIEFTAFIVHQS